MSRSGEIHLSAVKGEEVIGGDAPGIAAQPGQLRDPDRGQTKSMREPEQKPRE
ncbi:hypothetical protein [Saccharopolyspora hattusasensis]|uniref:hypothetical protein n=1 Tax=Saccharopolyspora hattusasensis TaxID=1128679 RepID=UPI003D95B7EF